MYSGVYDDMTDFGYKSVNILRAKHYFSFKQNQSITL